ncbi:MAG TPA: 4-hydroxythreonine-4-phosphate dehydrogenase PdxA [Polyangiales bacterium]|nr:4-hydroxythreonine-4-phosphate dehydrogenase PdxA [Polyangiales bacterium]
MNVPPPLAISTGDPGGVGPEVALRAVASAARDDRVVLFGDASSLRERAAICGIAIERLRTIEPGAEGDLPPGSVGLIDVGTPWSAAACRHAATAEGGAAQLAALDGAITAALAGRVRALVTAPMSKAAVNLTGQEFTGHTEHLARAAGLPDDSVTMMFLGPRLRVALATTHVAVADLPREVTAARVQRAIEHLADALLRLDARAGMAERVLRLAVTGLNPHAGEGGLFGDEEPRAIAPAIAAAAARPPFSSGRVQLQGPLGAETALRLAASGDVDGVVAMTHDQATIASKLLDWTLAVNVTWGLPFVRTSVDHGVAYDAAERGSADPAGMVSALAMAQQLTR